MEPGKDGNWEDAGALQPAEFRIAEAVAKAAFIRSQDKAVQTPFSENATLAFHESITGGKSDDITVIAAWVTVQG